DERFAPIASPAREFPFDVLVAASATGLEGLPEGARVGTSAPRRRAQIAALRSDVDLVPLRGNIETRMGFVTSGELDAVVLAGAGLSRTNRLDRASHRFGPEEMLPAPAQGALAVEARADDDYAAAAVATVDDPETTLAVAAERRVLAVLEAGCTAPVGAYASLDGDELRLDAVVASVAGTRVLRESASAVIPGRSGDGSAHGETVAQAARLEAARALGEQVAAALLERGAAEVVLVAGEFEDERTPLAPPISGKPPDGGPPE
ncbi:hydroxymethylbilane synthase, partial [Dietzia sp.]|uniref:hydroxymethylbilane synthase n=1 Tax=Dietzia sp. TaxID=1871616 RepID=UPI002FD8DEC2